MSRLRYSTMPMAGFGDGENAGRALAARDLSRVEGALSERLIVPPAERRDHGGYHAASAIRHAGA
ncbi:hypothetical protein [Cupriavidus taiwanensis]